MGSRRFLAAAWCFLKFIFIYSVGVDAACGPHPDQCDDTKFGLGLCSTWCNENGLWGCDYGTIPGTDGRNTDNVDYSCTCVGCNGCDDITCTTTTSTATETTLGGTGGDPITVAHGERVRYELPKGRPSLLIRSGGVSVFAKGNLKTGDAESQWISDIDVYFDGTQIVHVGRKDIGSCSADSGANQDGHACRLSCTWKASQSCGLDAVGVIKHNVASGVSQQKCESLCLSKFLVPGCIWLSAGRCFYGEGADFNEHARLVSSAQCSLIKKTASLSTMRITIRNEHGELEDIVQPRFIAMRDGGLNVTVVEKKGKLGNVHKESVAIEAETMGLEISTERAKKFKDLQQSLRYSHLDVTVQRLGRERCGGILPEIWGLIPLSPSTAAMIKSIGRKSLH